MGIAQRREIDPAQLNGITMMAPLMGQEGGVIAGLREQFGLKGPAMADPGFNTILKPNTPGMA